MKTDLLVVDAAAPEADRIAHAAAVLLRGGLVAFPTETVYGLGALADDERAALSIYAAKGRPSHNPLISHLPGIEAARALAPVWTDDAERLAARFWPGPLTVVVPRAPSISRAVCGGLDAMALRVPAHPVALALLRAVGRPVAAPSANRSNQLSPTTAEHVMRGLDGRIDLVLDGGACRVGLESTVIDLCGPTPVVLRPGTITIEQIRAVVPAAQLRADVLAHGVARPSPGMDAKHYAPRTPLVVLDRAAMVAAILESSDTMGVLCIGSAPVEASARVVVAALSSDPDAYAAQLYERLHWLDAQGCDRILCERVPDSHAWDAARDRLQRASA